MTEPPREPGTTVDVRSGASEEAGPTPAARNGPPEAPPFSIRVERVPEDGRRFAVRATVEFGAPLRNSGLLAALDAECLRCLLAMLSFVTGNGDVVPVASQVAAALEIDEREAEHRLGRLTQSLWRGRPVAYRMERPAGPAAYCLSRAVVRAFAAGPADEPPRTDQTRPVPAGRERVIAQSRGSYGTPRAEAERLVLRQLGHSPEETQDTPEGDARRRLLALGVAAGTVERLVSEHPAEEIRRQLEWLPLRGARRPERLIVAAIDNDYDPPAGYRPLQAVEDGMGSDTGEELSGGIALPVPEPGQATHAENAEEERG